MILFDLSIYRTTKGCAIEFVKLKAIKIDTIAIVRYASSTHTLNEPRLLERMN